MEVAKYRCALVSSVQSVDVRLNGLISVDRIANATSRIMKTQSKYQWNDRKTVAHAAWGSREFDRKKWGPKIFPLEVVFALAVQVTASHPHLPPSLVLGVRLCRNIDEFIPSEPQLSATFSSFPTSLSLERALLRLNKIIALRSRSCMPPTWSWNFRKSVLRKTCFPNVGRSKSHTLLRSPTKQRKRAMWRGGFSRRAKQACR